MKKLLKTLVLLLSIGLFFSSCHRNEAKPTNHFTFRGKDYKLSSLYIEQSTSQNNAGAYDFEFIFLSPGFTVYENQNYIDSVSGSGPIIYFILSSATTNFPAADTYQVDTSIVDGYNGPAGKITTGGVDPDYVSSTKSDPKYFITGGASDISGSMDNVDIKFYLVDENGNAVTGFYKGAVTKRFNMPEKSLRVDNKRQNNKLLQFVVGSR